MISIAGGRDVLREGSMVSQIRLEWQRKDKLAGNTWHLFVDAALLLVVRQIDFEYDFMT